MKEEVKKNKNQIANKSVSENLLVSYRSALYKIQAFFDNIEFNPDDVNESIKIAQSIVSVGEKLGKSIETLKILEAKVQSEEIGNSKIRGGAKLSLLENEEL